MKSPVNKYSFLCYALITFGQLWLYALNLKSADIYERVTLHTTEWVGSHSILLIGAVLIFPATLALKDYFKNKSKYLIYSATILTLLGATALIGQYILDFYLVTRFENQTASSAFSTLDQIRSNQFIKLVCYDLIAAWLLGQLLFIILFIGKKTYPKWALGVFIIGITLVLFGNNLHELYERLSYLMISISIWPVFKERFF